MSDSNFFGNGQYHLNRLSLFYRNDPNDIHSEEHEIDLGSAFVQIGLYESIFDQVMSGSVSIMDTVGIDKLLPIYGEERIELSFNTAGNEENPIEFTGVVYKVSEGHRISEHAKGHTIHFISEAAILSQRSFVQRAFKTSCAEAVKKIFNESLTGGTSTKQLSTLPTKGIQSFVFGAIKPLEAISIICNSSSGSGDEHGFVFFEDNKEFHFTALEYLYQQDPVTEYYYKVKGMFSDVQQRSVETFNAIQQFKDLEENSFLDRLMDGQHGRRAMRFDLLTKSVTEIDYDKERFFDEQKSLGIEPYLKPIISSPNDVLEVEYSSGGLIPLKDIVASKMRKKELGTIRGEITVSGDSFNRVGQTCLATFPIWKKEQEVDVSMEPEKFLITHIHHEITNTAYMQTMMLEKDSHGAKQ